MARTAGRFGVLYISVTSGGAATPFSYCKQFKFSAKTDKYDGTAMGDTSKVYVTGLPDSSATVDGFWDQAAGFGSMSLLQSAVDGYPRKWYFYPVGGAAPYQAGTAYFDCDFDYSVSDIVKVAGTMSAATPTFFSG